MNFYLLLVLVVAATQSMAAETVKLFEMIDGEPIYASSVISTPDKEETRYTIKCMDGTSKILSSKYILKISDFTPKKGDQPWKPATTRPTVNEWLQIPPYKLDEEFKRLREIERAAFAKWNLDRENETSALYNTRRSLEARQQVLKTALDGETDPALRKKHIEERLKNEDYLLNVLKKLRNIEEAVRAAARTR